MHLRRLAGNPSYLNGDGLGSSVSFPHLTKQSLSLSEEQVMTFHYGIWKENTRVQTE